MTYNDNSLDYVNCYFFNGSIYALHRSLCLITWTPVKDYGMYMSFIL
jgi:hypothetical protein